MKRWLIIYANGCQQVIKANGIVEAISRSHSGEGYDIKMVLLLEFES